MFMDDVQRAKIAEEWLIDYCADKGIKLIDVRDNINYQLEDVDFILNGTKIDMKYDYKANETGNLAFEIGKYSKAKMLMYDGNLNTTTSKYFLYWLNPKEIYKVDVAQLRKALADNKRYYRLAHTNNDGDNYSVSIMALININSLHEWADCITKVQI